MKKYILFILMMTSMHMIGQEDPYIWLEEVDSKDALEFAEEHSKKSLVVLQSHPLYRSIFGRMTGIPGAYGEEPDVRIFLRVSLNGRHCWI